MEVALQNPKPSHRKGRKVVEAHEISQQFGTSNYI